MPKGHTAYNWRHGRTVAERLASRTVHDGACLLWTGPCDDDGYGVMQALGEQRAHRIAWKLRHGPIPEGMDVLHHCDVPSCVEDSHLYLGTDQDNVDDKMRRGRHRASSGSRNGNAKLTDQQRIQILTDPRSGEELSKLLGVDRSTINRVRRKAGQSRPKGWAAQRR